MPEKDMFLRLVSRQSAWDRLCSYMPMGPRMTEEASLIDAAGRILGRDLISPVDLPGFNRATVDGYAVKASDTFGASHALPAMLTIAGEAVMGQECSIALPRFSCIKVATGAMLPKGADAAVMVEVTERLDDSTIAFEVPAAPGENMVRADEDCRRGEAVIRSGRKLLEQEIAMAGALGFTKLEVAVGPRVAIISTGDELTPIGEPAAIGKVSDINGVALAVSVIRDGGTPKLHGIVRDEFNALKEAMSEALRDADMLLVSGGSSIGARDHVSSAIAELGKPGVIVHGIGIKPGKPTIIAICDGKPVFGLPGHPVSCLTVYRVIVRPAIRRWMGSEQNQNLLTAFCEVNVSSAPGREDYVPVRIGWHDGRAWAEPVFGKSSLISSLVMADGAMIIPEESEGIRQGEPVLVEMWR